MEVVVVVVLVVVSSRVPYHVTESLADPPITEPVIAGLSSALGLCLIFQTSALSYISQNV